MKTNITNKLTLYIIIPCYNEEVVLPQTAPIFLKKINELQSKNLISEKSRILFVDDGSKDSTWNIISKLSMLDKRYIGISQSKNRGHQNAIYAGFTEAVNNCDVSITIDCDGQDDINAINEMILEYNNGSDIVYGVRSDRKSDSFLKKFTAQTYYKVLKFLGCDIVYNHADYRLLSKRVLLELLQFKENSLFWRGLVPLLGFRSSKVFYKREKRISGTTHYTISKMIHLAIDGIISLSIKPLHLISKTGLVLFISGLIGLLCKLISIINKTTFSQFLEILFIFCLFTGLQLMCLGIVGEYIGKTYFEIKHRPKCIISKRTNEYNECEK